MLPRLLPARRLLRAERAFFDAYGRGGGRDGRELVVPLDYFTDRDVAAALRAWLRGAPLDTDALLAAWRRMEPAGDEARFFRNLAHFLSLVGR